MEQIINKLFSITEANYKKQIILATLITTFINFSQLRFIEHIDTFYALGLSMKISCFTFMTFFWISLFAGGYSFKKKVFQSLMAFKWTLIVSFSYVAIRFTNDLSEVLVTDRSLSNTRLWLNSLFRHALLGLIMLFVLMAINYLIEGLVEYFQMKSKKQTK